MKNNTSKTLFGSIILITEALSNKAVGLISTIILARVLVPEDFGIVAIAVLLLGIVDVLGNIGGMQYLLKQDKIDNSDLNAYFTLNFISKGFLSVLFFSSSYAAAYFFDDERLIAIIQALSFLVFIRACHNPAEAYLRREHQYSGIVKVNIIAKLISVTLAITIALSYKSYWALILGQIVQGSIAVLGLYVVKPYIPSFELSKLKEQWKFSSWLIPQSILGYLRTQLDTFIISAKFEKDTLGSYHVLKYLCYMPISNVIIPAIQPLTTELAKVRKDRFQFTNQYSTTLLATIILATPITTLMYAYDDLVIMVLLGEQWLKYAEMLGILSFLIPATVLLHQANRAIIVNGETKLLLYYEVASFCLIYGLLYLFVGFEQILTFTSARVGLEMVSTFLFFSAVTVYYTCLKSYLKILISNSLLILVSITSLLISSMFDIESKYNLVTLALASTLYLLTYITFTILICLILRKHLLDWDSFSKILSNAIPVRFLKNRN